MCPAPQFESAPGPIWVMTSLAGAGIQWGRWKGGVVWAGGRWRSWGVRLRWERRAAGVAGGRSPGWRRGDRQGGLGAVDRLGEAERKRGHRDGRVRRRQAKQTERLREVEAGAWPGRAESACIRRTDLAPRADLARRGRSGAVQGRTPSPRTGRKGGASTESGLVLWAGWGRKQRRPAVRLGSAGRKRGH